jgi:hypothetical protein
MFVSQSTSSQVRGIVGSVDVRRKPPLFVPLGHAKGTPSWAFAERRRLENSLRRLRSGDLSLRMNSC